MTLPALKSPLIILYGVEFCIALEIIQTTDRDS
jgi:hypothetical protein